MGYRDLREKYMLRIGILPFFTVAMSLLLSGSAIGTQYPTPSCRAAAPDLVQFAIDDSMSELDAVERSNARYLIKYLDGRGVRPVKMYVFRSKFSSLYYSNDFSLFFPNDSCPDGCVAYAVQHAESGFSVTPFHFQSYMVFQPPPPNRALVVLHIDKKHLISISKGEVRPGVYVTNLNTVVPGSETLYHEPLFNWSESYPSCLVSGKFVPSCLLPGECSPRSKK